MINNIASVISSSTAPWLLFGTNKLLALVVVAILAIILIALKGYALWHAAKRDERWWFAAILVLNTIGILELVYLAFIVKKWNKVQQVQQEI